MTRTSRAPWKDIGSFGPPTLVTVVLAIVGPENGSALAAFTVAPSNAVGTIPRTRWPVRPADPVDQLAELRGRLDVAAGRRRLTTIEPIERQLYYAAVDAAGC